jgi:hypothetical protein
MWNMRKLSCEYEPHFRAFLTILVMTKKEFEENVEIEL